VELLAKVQNVQHAKQDSTPAKTNQHMAGEGVTTVQWVFSKVEKNRINATSAEREKHQFVWLHMWVKVKH
jgi:hypothetical protein